VEKEKTINPNNTTTKNNNSVNRRKKKRGEKREKGRRRRVEHVSYTTTSHRGRNGPSGSQEAFFGGLMI
jgi:hypothetical protein